MDCGTKRDWSTVPKQYRCGSRLVPWQDYFGTDTVLEFLLGDRRADLVIYAVIVLKHLNLTPPISPYQT